MKSRGEKLLHSMTGWAYEPTKIKIERTYIPDFVTPSGVIVEVKEYLTRQEFSRVRDAHASITRSGGVFVVLVYGESRATTWPKKGYALVEYLQKQGIPAALFSEQNQASAKLYVEALSSCARNGTTGKVAATKRLPKNPGS